MDLSPRLSSLPGGPTGTAPGTSLPAAALSAPTPAQGSPNQVRPPVAASELGLPPLPDPDPPLGPPPTFKENQLDGVRAGKPLNAALPPPEPMLAQPQPRFDRRA